MPDYLVYSVGFTAQLLFSSRLIVQWLKSEKAGKVVSPAIFWKLSLLASFLLFIYGWMRDDFAIILGQVIAYFIYIWNLKIEGNWQNLSRLFRQKVYIVPIVVIALMLKDYDVHIERLFRNRDIPTLLLIWGSLGQVIFTMRFIYQWLYSRKLGKSVLPMGFWLISVVGSLMILSYAVYRKDPVLFLGQGFGFTVYLRNIYLLAREKRRRSHIYDEGRD